MKTLLLVRHAKSSWKDPSLDDFDRPLNRRGERDAPFMARAFAQRGLKVDRLVSSPANRALTTAHAFAKALGLPESAVHADRAYYHASLSEWDGLLAALPDAAATVMAFGHNPELTELANRLAQADIDNVPTCGIVCIRFQAQSWSALGPGELAFFDYPKRYPQLQKKS